jgi:hypothetical protein
MLGPAVGEPASDEIFVSVVAIRQLGKVCGLGDSTISQIISDREAQIQRDMAGRREIA